MINIEDFRQTDYLDYLKQNILNSLSSNPSYIPTKFLYKNKGAILFEKFIKSNKHHSSKNESEIFFGSDLLKEIVLKNSTFIELASGNFKRTYDLLCNCEKENFTFIAVDIEKEPSLRILKLFESNCKNNSLTLKLADFEEIVANKLFGVLNDKTCVFWMGNSCTNILPSKLKQILSDLYLVSPENLVIVLGLSLDSPNDTKCKKVVLDDGKDYFNKFRKSSLKHISKTFNVQIPWEQLSWNSYYKIELNAYVSSFISKVDWYLSLDQNTVIEFYNGSETIVGYSHTYSITEIKDLINSAGWKLFGLESNKEEYHLLFLKK